MPNVFPILLNLNHPQVISTVRSQKQGHPTKHISHKINDGDMLAIQEPKLSAENIIDFDKRKAVTINNEDLNKGFQRQVQRTIDQWRIFKNHLKLVLMMRKEVNLLVPPIYS